MFDKKSDYALNKQDQDSIIYISVNGRIRLTRADFSSEEEFLKWKAWSDADYHQTERKAGASTIIGWLWMITWMWSERSSPPRMNFSQSSMKQIYRLVKKL